ncbi:MAG: alpha-L-arabinofuranosidase, partial [Mucilaginibacter polytrichastri]|nr:alpha-L-arabinofuranosidase [Mucilaginibacter polytrichastri]
AAFMTGLERNADVVRMASYAPLFAHVEAWQWRPDLIWFDNLKSMVSPNYYVQKMFSAHRGDQVVPVLKDGRPLTGADSVYASASVDKKAGKVYIKVVNVSGKKVPLTLSLDGFSGVKKAQIETIRAQKLSDYNSLENPEAIKPFMKTIAYKGKKMQFTLDDISANVIVLPVN